MARSRSCEPVSLPDRFLLVGFSGTLSSLFTVYDFRLLVSGQPKQSRFKPHDRLSSPPSSLRCASRGTRDTNSTIPLKRLDPLSFGPISIACKHERIVM